MVSVDVPAGVGAAARGKRSGLLRPLLLLLLFAATAFLTIYMELPPAPVPATAPPADFSSARALKHVQAIAQRPRPIGSAESGSAREYISGELRAQGLNPLVQTALALNSEKGPPYEAATVRNVVARLEGTGSDKAVLLMAHYDSVPTGPGASDDGVGVAALLETARALKSGPPPSNDVIFLFTEGEEVGLLGARAFVGGHPWAKDVGVALNFEARGNDGPVIMFETSEGNGWMIDDLAAAAPNPVANSLSYEIYKRMPNDTDLTVFKKGGMPGMNFAYIGGLTHYHTAADDLMSVSESSLQHQGSYALSLARSFGSHRLDEGRGRGNAVYFNLLGPLFVHYGGALVNPLAVLAVLFYAGVLVLGFRRGLLTAKGIAFGALALAASGVAASLTVTIVWRLARSLHAGYESTPWGDPYSGGFYVVAMVLLTLAVVAALYNWFRRRSSVANLAAGALLWWVLLTVAVSLMMPGASYLLVWPLLFALAGTAVLFLMWERESASKWVMLALTAVPAVALFSPLVGQVFTALTLKAAGFVALLLVLLCGLLVPHLQILAGSKPWAFPAAAGALGLILIVAGLAAAGAGGRPQMSNIFYGLNADTGEALWASVDAAPDEWTAQFFPSGGQQRQVTAFFPIADDHTFLTAAAETAPLPAPEVSLLEDTRDGETRALRLRVTSPRRAPLVSIYTRSTGELLGASINGVAIPTPVRGHGLWGLDYYAFPEEGVELTLRVKASGQVKVRVNDLSYSLPAGLPFKPRPAHMMPSPLQFSDATVVTKSFNF
jgi:hypothetical protein